MDSVVWAAADLSWAATTTRCTPCSSSCISCETAVGRNMKNNKWMMRRDGGVRRRRTPRKGSVSAAAFLPVDLLPDIATFITTTTTSSSMTLPSLLTTNLPMNLASAVLNHLPPAATRLLLDASFTPALSLLPTTALLLTLAAPPSSLSSLLLKTWGRSSTSTKPSAAEAELPLLLLPGSDGGNEEEELLQQLPLHYDPSALMAYYRNRPLLVLSRLSFVAMECSLLFMSLLIDARTTADPQRQQQQESLRSSELAAMLSRLGPTAVKIGQSLSTRPDLLPPAYIEALQGLQDSVQPFCNKEAMTIISEELGRPIEQMFSEFSAEPIAAASLGQVYRAKLRSTGKTVAVKVQRPGVLDTISLDLYVLRTIAIALTKLPNQKNSSDLLTFLDHWAAHIFQELDYTQEAKNAEKFSSNMISMPNVVVPKPMMQYTSKKVLTTSWMDGEKLSKSRDGDAAHMVSVALNCYLCQLLDTGFLHADPHPGNLLRTPDGRLCVLDFGLMLQVTEEQRYALMECISHLAHSDYDKAAGDLINLGFTPSNPSEREQAEAMLPEASKILGRLVRGGGMQQMDVDQILAELTGLASDYGIVIPPYFMMILRAFSILEGMGLKSNPNYVIIDECYPYICKQLLTDNSPRAQSIFKYFLYGRKGQLDARRVEAVFRGFQKYRATMTATTSSSGGDPLSKEIVSSLLAPEGSFIQELLLAELVRIVDALSREAMVELSKMLMDVGPPAPVVQLLGIVWPPSSSIVGWLGHVKSYSLTQEDEEAIELVRRLWNLMASEAIPTPDIQTVAFGGLTAMIPDIAAGAFSASARFWLMLMHRKALRLADDLDGTDSVTYWNKDPAAYARHVKLRPPPQLRQLPFHHSNTKP